MGFINPCPCDVIEWGVDRGKMGQRQRVRVVYCTCRSSKYYCTNIIITFTFSCVTDICTRWKYVARPWLEPRAFRWPCEHSTTELPSYPVISPTILHLKPTPVTYIQNLLNNDLLIWTSSQISDKSQTACMLNRVPHWNNHQHKRTYSSIFSLNVKNTSWHTESLIHDMCRLTTYVSCLNV